MYRLKKALYGLKQSPRAWYERFVGFLKQKGYKRGTIYNTLFLRRKGEDLLVIQIYVDDIVFGATNEDLWREFEECMKSKFEMSSMGEMSIFLGLKVNQSNEGIFISQTKYILDMFKNLGFEDFKPPTPMSVSTKLENDEKGEPFNPSMYRSLISSLLYLTSSQPDIMFSVCMCARF